jgi:hypothetical protein
VTEPDWLACTDPQPMLEFLRGKASERKLRLFAAASFRRLVALLPDPRQRRGIEVLEQLGEGAITPDACRGVVTGVQQAIPPNGWSPGSPPPAEDRYYTASMLYREFCSSSISSSSIGVHAVHASAGLADDAGERHEQARLMRCIFGNPFRLALLSPAVLTWNDATVVRLAQAAYEERKLPEGTLDNGRLAVLADALEEAGCTDADVLGHLRGQGPHVRGCWAVDLCLGKS